MTASRAEQIEPGVIALKGDLCFATASALHEAVRALLERQPSHCVLDFSGVGRVDSSALALWLASWRDARRIGVELEARGWPADLQSIAHLVGLEEALG